MPRPNNQSVVVRERTSRPMGHHEQLRTVAVDAEAPHRPRQTPAPRRCFPAEDWRVEPIAESGTWRAKIDENVSLRDHLVASSLHR